MRFTLFATMMVFALAGPALAQKGKGMGKGKQNDNIERMAEQAEDRGKQARDNIRDDENWRDDDSSAQDYADDDSSDRRSNDDHSSEARSDDTSRDNRSDDTSRDDRSDDDSGRHADGMRGNAKAEEMRNRRDERKQIKEEYRADREPGQERATPSEDSPDGESAAKKPKKPWWKFWDE